MRWDDEMNAELEIILARFDLIRYPGDSDLSCSSSIEGSYVVDFFKGRSWRELSVKTMRAEYPGDPSACLAFMSDAAFRYFFPGFMKMAFLEYDSADAIFDVVIDRIYFAALEEGRERALFNGYGHDQLCAIAQYTELLSVKYCQFYPENLAAIAIEKYWHQFLQD